MDFAGLKEKAGELLNKIAGAFPLALEKGRAFLAEKIALLLERFPAERKRIILFVSAGAAVFFLILIIALAATHSGGPKKNEPPMNMIAEPAIPPEELFMPGEPDFVPKFIPGREPRSSWSVEDVRPYWKIPDKSDRWREEIKSAVDKLLEAVP